MGLKILRRTILAFLLVTVLPGGLALAKETDIVQAAGRGDLAKVQSLLAKGADVNIQAKNGATALFVASELGHADVVKELLSKGVT